MNNKTKVSWLLKPKIRIADSDKTTQLHQQSKIIPEKTIHLYLQSELIKLVWKFLGHKVLKAFN